MAFLPEGIVNAKAWKQNLQSLTPNQAICLRGRTTLVAMRPFLLTVDESTQASWVEAWIVTVSGELMQV